MTSCDIITVVWNQEKATRECIDSIINNTSHPSLIVIDNASDAATAGYLRSLEKLPGLEVTLVRNNHNLGFVKASNQGMALARAPYVCLINNDTITTPGWLDEMIKVMDRYPEIGILNPSSNVFGQSCEEGRLAGYAAELRNQFSGEIQELYTCRGFCMLLRKEVIARIGYFDEIYSPGYFEESDYSLKAQKGGFALARAKGAYVYHKGSLSFKELNGTDDLFKKNEEIFYRRWGRPSTVAYLVDTLSRKEDIDAIATTAARGGHQVLILLKNGLDWPVSVDHLGIRKIEVNSAFFGISALFKIIKRRKKKKIDILLTDNGRLGSMLKALRGLHKADVLIRPEKDHLIGLLKNR